MISRPNQNHMKQNDLGKSLDPFAHTVLFTNCQLKVVHLLFFLNIMLLCVSPWPLRNVVQNCTVYNH